MRTIFFCLFLLTTIGLTPNELAEAREVSGTPASQFDWSRDDRIRWQIWSRNSSLEMLKSRDLSKNTFFQAAIANTKARRHQEYTSPDERSVYYDWVCYMLESESATAKGVSGIRFFHAANVVTSRYFGVAMVDNPITAKVLLVLNLFGYGGIDKTDIVILKSINEELFEKNLRMVNNLVFEWQYIRDPNGLSGSPITALEFDEKMVQFEQRIVSTLLKRYQLSKNNADRINRSARFSLINKRIVLNIGDYLSAVGIETFDFFRYEHRVALGMAYIYIFRQNEKGGEKKKTIEDYSAAYRSLFPTQGIVR